MIVVRRSPASSLDPDKANLLAGYNAAIAAGLGPVAHAAGLSPA
jgi:hypothetical protein